MGKYADSENNARKALVFSRKAGLGENIISRHKVVLANALRQQGKYPEALKNLEQATVELKNSNTDKQLFATATNNLGALYFWMGNLPKAKLLLEQGLSLRLALNEDKKQNLDIANSYLDLGCCEFKLGQTGKAKEHLLLALKLRKNELGDEHPETLNAKANLAALLDASENSADREQALKLLQEVVTSGSRKLDAKHPELIRYQHEYAEALTNSGNLLSNKGQQEAALKAFKDAIQIEDGISKIRGYKDITYAVTLANAAAVLTRLNRPAESQAMLKKAIAIIDALPLSERNSPDAKAIRRSSKLSKSIRKHH